MSYFREIPNLEYQSFLSTRKSSDEYLLVKNIFRRVKLRDDLHNVFTIFNKYQIEEGARPDTVAQEIYGSSQYDWVVLVGANIINVRNEWPLSDRDIYRYSEQLYGNDLNEIHHYETTEVKDSNGRLILPAGKIIDSFFKLPHPSDDVSASFNSSSIAINNINASGVILSPLNTDNITSTSDYGLFTFNLNALTWNYILNTNIDLTKLSFVDGIANVFDNFSYTTIDGFQRTITIKTRILIVDNGGSISYTRTLSSQKYTNKVSYIQYFDSGFNRIITKYNVTNGISNYEYEVIKNDKKRSIYILKPSYLQQAINDIKKAMTYDRSSQYVNDKLIKTQNTRVSNP